MNALPTKYIATPSASSATPLASTVLGSTAALLGLDETDNCVVVQPLEAATVTVDATKWPIPVSSFKAGHPVTSLFDFGTRLTGAVVNFAAHSEHDRALSDDAPQWVTQWVLAGASAEELSGTAWLGAQLGEGREAEELTRGRLWVRWQCALTLIEQNTALPFTAATSDGTRQRKILTRVGTPTLDPQKNRLHAPGQQATGLLSFDLSQLLREVPGDHYQPALEKIGEAVASAAGRLMTSKYGEAPVPSLMGRPATFYPLLETSQPAAMPMLDFVPIGTPTDATEVALPTGLSLDTGAVSASGPARYVRHKKSFAWPAGKGLRIQLGMEDSGSSRSSVKLCSSSGSAIERNPPLIELTRTPKWGARVSTSIGTVYPLTELSGSPELDGATGVALPELNGRPYEILLFPDRQAYVYADGWQIASLSVPTSAGLDGTELSLIAAYSEGVFRLTHVSVEYFDVPSAYVSRTRPKPVITLPDGAKAEFFNGPLLSDGNTSGTAVRIGKNGAEFLFSVTEKCDLTLHGSLRKSPYDRSVSVTLMGVDGTTYTATFGAMSGSYQFKGVPAGRYHLSISNYSYQEAYIETTTHQFPSCTGSGAMGWSCWDGKQYQNFTRGTYNGYQSFTMYRDTTKYNTLYTDHALFVTDITATPA